MEHIALNHLSRKKKTLYTAPGLGDRVHGVFLMNEYAKQNNTQVVFYINEFHMFGYNATQARAEQKSKSWQEISDLFPYVDIEFWNTNGEILKDDIIEKKYKMYYYTPEKQIYINPYIKNKIVEDWNPTKIVTMQWDTADVSRRIESSTIDKLKNHYSDLGYEIIEIGMNQTLSEIKETLQRASYHIGVDSGMMHMANAFIPHDRIHIYTSRYISDHIARARENGSIIK